MPLDFATGRGTLLSVLPEAVLTTWAMLVLLHAAWRHQEPRAQRLTGWLSLAGVLVTAGVTIWLWRAGLRPLGVPMALAADTFRWAVTLIVLLGAALTILLSIDYLEREGIAVPEFHALVLFATVGMMLLAGASDLITLFLGLETMSVAVYVLAGINRASIQSAEAALKYFLLGAFASAFLLYGIALIYGATGTTRLPLIAAHLAGPDANPGTMLYAGLGLLFIGFAFKVAAVPFHMWAPDVYDGSPTPVTAFMAASVKAAAFAALVRVLLQAFPSLHASWDTVLWWLAAVTMLVGNLLALAQRNLKRMLAYSSVAHAGYLLAAVVSGSLAGAAALLFYLTFYTVTTVGSFAVVIAKGRGGERDVTVDDLTGLGDTHPLIALTMTICMLSLLGFPGTAGFIGKWYILVSATGAGYPVLAAVLVLTSVISAGYYLPIVMAMYMKRPVHDGQHADVSLPPAHRGILAAVLALLLLFGVWPNKALDLARQGSGAFRPTHQVPLATLPLAP
jgi:NADH-quinone oxidoreductase subunit N